MKAPLGIRVSNDVLWYLPIVILAATWELISRSGLISAETVPSLIAIARAAIELVRTEELQSNLFVSLYRGGAGLLIAVGIGCVLGVGMAISRLLDTLVSPPLELLYPIPKSALIPVTAIWLGFGDGSKILLVFLGCLLPVTVGAFNGVRGTDPILIWSARSMGAGKQRVIFDVMIPSALPEIMNGIRTAIALSFILVVSSELIVAREGAGYLIGFLGASGAYDAMFAVVLCVALLGFLADRVFIHVTQRILRWQTI
jgi:ABC-type nitrate/sulfonate/bicarbonate transport system permease component